MLAKHNFGCVLCAPKEKERVLQKQLSPVYLEILGEY